MYTQLEQLLWYTDLLFARGFVFVAAELKSLFKSSRVCESDIEVCSISRGYDDQ